MPMIALSPVGLSWQKTTCSWSAAPAGPLSLWDVANTLVTVATLLLSSRILVEPGSEPAYCVGPRPARMVPGESAEVLMPPGLQVSMQALDAFPYQSVTHSIDYLVTLSTDF